MNHTPLESLQVGAVSTAGRVVYIGDKAHLYNAAARIMLEGIKVEEGALVRVDGRYDGQRLHVDRYELVFQGRLPKELADLPGAQIRADLLAQVRDFFKVRGFLEVLTPYLTREPGTDVFLDPIRVEVHMPGQQLEAYLHTSPEFAMKGLLTRGFEKIWQCARVYRDGERSPVHQPEFTMLEWYRAWEPLNAIMDDVEALGRRLLPHLDTEMSWPRVTMQEVFLHVTGIDILAAQTLEALREQVLAKGLLEVRPADEWDDLFFGLVVEYVDPYLATFPSVFVTKWPARLAVLARRCETDPRAADRFEWYAGGLELANGFEELTCPDEQRARFQQDLQVRQRRGKRTMPMPQKFLEDLHAGLPPSAGVAVGFDRVAHLAGARFIEVF